MAPGTRNCPKWMHPATLPVLLALIVLSTSCQGTVVLAPFGSSEVFAVAFPLELPPDELEKKFRKHGIDAMIHENNLLVPMTDFAGLQYLSLSEISHRVRSGDPRHTPLSSLLVSSFTAMGPDRTWRIWYVPISTLAIYKSVQNAFSESGVDWAWDAQLPSPVLRLLWIVWLVWILLLLLDRKSVV